MADDKTLDRIEKKIDKQDDKLDKHGEGLAAINQHLKNLNGKVIAQEKYKNDIHPGEHKLVDKAIGKLETKIAVSNVKVGIYSGLTFGIVSVLMTAAINAWW